LICGVILHCNITLKQKFKLTKIGILQRYKKLITVVFFTLAFFNACKDDENNNIPLVDVNFQINVNDPAYIQLQTVGGWVEVSGGSRGIILFRISNEVIKAYDRHCTFQSSNTCALVSVDPTNITASDPCCGSAFLMSNGSVSKPPATSPLKSYTTLFSDPFLTVTN